MSYYLPARLAWYDVPASQGDGEAAVYVAAVPDGHPAVMEEPARSIWLCAPGAANAQEVAQRVGEALGFDGTDIEQDVAAFLTRLLSMGYLTDIPPQRSSGTGEGL